MPAPVRLLETNDGHESDGHDLSKFFRKNFKEPTGKTLLQSATKTLSKFVYLNVSHQFNTRNKPVLKTAAS